MWFRFKHDKKYHELFQRIPNVVVAYDGDSSKYDCDTRTYSTQPPHLWVHKTSTTHLKIGREGEMEELEKVEDTSSSKLDVFRQRRFLFFFSVAIHYFYHGHPSALAFFPFFGGLCRPLVVGRSTMKMAQALHGTHAWLPRSSLNVCHFAYP